MDISTKLMLAAWSRRLKHHFYSDHVI